MIRINLLPVKHVKKVQAGQRQIFIFLLALLAEVIVLFFVHQMKSSDVDERKRRAAILLAEVELLKKDVGDFDRLKAQYDQLLAQQKTINDLQKGREGPVWVMRELSDLLTPGKGPSFDQADYEALLRANPNAGFNPRWNPYRLWLVQVQESGGNIRLMGKAKDYDDVAEFNKRINLSKFFEDDFLERNILIQDKDLGQKVVQFSLRAKVKYY